jgi:molybdenum-dependent DNA-binding transcriptional regulator ModE
VNTRRNAFLSLEICLAVPFLSSTDQMSDMERASEAIVEDALLQRIRGGGGDGGSTGAESRSSYLEMYKEKKVEKVSAVPHSEVIKHM